MNTLEKTKTQVLVKTYFCI